MRHAYKANRLKTTVLQEHQRRKNKTHWIFLNILKIRLQNDLISATETYTFYDVLQQRGRVWDDSRMGE